MKLNIVVPAYNEEQMIERTLRDLEARLKIPHRVIVVNDHSTDSTAEQVRKVMRDHPNIELMDNRFGKGFVAALKTGFAAVDSGVVVPVMADLCDQPETIEVMYGKIKEGYDVVCGSRYMRGGRKIGGPLLQSFFSRFVGLTMHLITGIPTVDVPNSFKMYRKEVLDSIEIEGVGFEVSMEMALKAYFDGFKMTEVPTVWRARTAGKSNFRLIRIGPHYFKRYLWAIRQRLRGYPRANPKLGTISSR